MKSLYNKSNHCFQEQQIPLPDQRDYVGNDKGYAEAYHAYAHQQPTRTIACRPGDVWEEGKIYEEGKDYRVAKIERISSGNSQKIDDVFEIVPLAPPAQEAELWKKIFRYLDLDKDYDACITDLQQKYRLSLKSEQPEAVEFGDFLKMYASIEHTGKMLWWDKIQGSSRYYSTEQLYQIFKQKQ